ncbi:tRNA (adenosine(37)-N6)-dimethylallyltransferase MiaA [Aminithiophilus ramosus]|uniref:tRNA dimethylallyltransferase n=2 Tax=Synergistales TaxID=649776 RepID=A0A9Q7EYH1_9BACT|nr:tRNA (adenosine(37)-N6)-dimethylallyltransferase MiaA [Aminithiophilus ramosus]QTX31242.1 tRNA (adenosine(37)-N6)-dimethylallyltransferase MiaA [Aminithiophilus ramosus]QVL35042.1 tRNA (adenosine(37)-N6)-dimethylallyltransferase MiaA [Synergistota bacterium]
MEEKARVLCLIGPTAVGKTSFSLALARSLGAEVISVDSRQVYRYMDIGTDKADKATRRAIIHHLIDVVDPDEIFTAADFRRLAEEAVRRLRRRGRTPLFVGGTMFYYRALFGSLLSDDLPSDEALRTRLEEEARLKGKKSLYDRLTLADPQRAAELHPNDLRRVLRALELLELTGRAPSTLFRERSRLKSPFDPLYIGLTCPREELVRRIDLRVREQFRAGYVDEVRWLLERGFDERFPSMQGFGYREIAAHLRGTISLDEAIEGDIRSTKAFARRQMTWFRKFEPALWYDRSRVDQERLLEEVIGICRRHLDVGSSS